MIKFEAARLHFLSNVFVAVAVVAKTFLSDARQPEVRPFPFLYAWTLPNLYC